MSRRVFISFCYEDQGKAKGFNLLRWNKNVETSFVGRHLLDPIGSSDDAYITRCIRDQIKNTSVTVVLIGRGAARSEWVRREIAWSLSKDVPNGIVGIKLYADAKVPAELHDCGAEILDWHPHMFDDAIERAAVIAGRPCLALAGAPCAR